MGVTGINLNNSFQRMNSQGLNGGLKNVSFGKSCCNDTFTSSNSNNNADLAAKKYPVLLKFSAAQSAILEKLAEENRKLKEKLNIQA
jgi:hypothetical protein